MLDCGLVLEGGGMRGVYTAGVLDFFMEENLYFRRVYGVSAGACHACSYISRQKGRALRTVTDYLDNPRYAGMRSLVTSGDFFGVDMIYREIPEQLLPYDYDVFNAAEETLTVVLTNCRTGQAEYRRVTDIRTDMRYVQASSSLPLLSRMVKIDGGIYLDGGIADSIPVEKSISDGNAKTLVVLTRHKGYHKEADRMMPLLRAKYKKWPALVESIERRHINYNRTLKLLYKLEKQGGVFIIQPNQPVKIGRLEKDREKLYRLYRVGYREARDRRRELLNWLSV